MLSGAPLKGILFDVGGPLVDESLDYVYDMEVVRTLISAEIGRDVTDREIERARDIAVMSWSPSFTESVIWQFLKPDSERTERLYDEALTRIFTHRESVTLADGVAEVIPKLASRYKLALAGNQPEYMKEKLERTGLLRHFTSTVLSSDLGVKKPDSRFFLEICARLGESPENCLMVGDRLDNDIHPANVLGMRTVWIRIGPHAIQQPRLPEDVPDAIIDKMSDLPGIIDGWERAGN